MIDFFTGLLVGAAIAYYVGRWRGYVAGSCQATKGALGYAIRKQNEAGWPMKAAGRDDYGQKIEK